MVFFCGSIVKNHLCGRFTADPNNRPEVTLAKAFKRPGGLQPEEMGDQIHQVSVWFIPVPSVQDGMNMGCGCGRSCIFLWDYPGLADSTSTFAGWIWMEMESFWKMSWQRSWRGLCQKHVWNGDQLEITWDITSRLIQEGFAVSHHKRHHSSFAREAWPRTYPPQRWRPSLQRPMPTATGRCTTWSLLRGWPAPVQRKCEIQWSENSKLWADWIDVSIIGKKSEDYWEIRRANDVSYEAGLKVWFEKGLCSQPDTLSTSIARPTHPWHPWHPCMGCVVKLPT